MTALENKLVAAYQAQGLNTKMSKLKVSGEADLLFPLRPAYGTKGNKVVLWANYFEMGVKPKVVYAYNLEVHKVRPNKGAQRQVDPKTRIKNKALKTDVSGRKLAIIIQLAMDKLREEDPKAVLATEFKSKLISLHKLKYNDDCLEVTFKGENSNKTENFFVRIVDPIEASFDATLQYLKTMSDKADPNGFPKFAVPVDALGVILGYTPRKNPEVSPVGSARFFPIGPTCVEKQLGVNNRISAIRGYFQSVRLGTGRALLNVNVTSGVFRTAVSVADLCRWANIAQYGGSNPPDPGTTAKTKALSNFLSKARVKCVFRDGNGRDYEAKKTMLGLAGISSSQINRDVLKSETVKFKQNFQWGGPKDVWFKMEPREGETTVMGNRRPGHYTVHEYSKWKYGIDFDAKLPLVNLGRPDKPLYVPAERCTIIGGQSVRSKLSGEETTLMLDFACRSPFANALSISTESRSALGLDENPTLQQFGLTIDRRLLTVWGRELQSPSVLYLKNKEARTFSGGWNMRDVQVAEAGPKITNWAWVQVTESERYIDAAEAVGKFAAFLANTGIPIDTAPRRGLRVRTSSFRYQDDVEAAFKELEQRAAKGPPNLFVLVILPRQDTTLYSVIKTLGDCQFGFHTICAVEKMFTKENPMTFANIGLKWNLKNGGINHRVKDPIGIVAQGKTMVVGYDVTHPTNMGLQPGNKDLPPSIVGLVASVDKDLGQWPAVAWEQESGQEMLDSKLTESFKSRLELWRKKNRQSLPEFIVVYRDGVSEGQFSQVLEQELPQMREACRVMYPNGRMPKLSIIVSVKRHQTRFYPTREDHMDAKSRNIKNGTVVDRGVTQARYWDFFLTAHTALKGTARPARYTVLLDEIFTTNYGMTEQAANQLEKFTHDLCYLFGRATKAVSICPPAYYADIVCERARVHRPEYFDVSDTMSSSVRSGGGLSADDGAKVVHARLRDTMYYI